MLFVHPLHFNCTVEARLPVKATQILGLGFGCPADKPGSASLSQPHHQLLSIPLKFRLIFCLIASLVVGREVLNVSKETELKRLAVLVIA